jgi:fibronectin-binding autotransporter adhesin
MYTNIIITMSKFLDIRGNVDSTNAEIGSETTILMKTDGLTRMTVDQAGDISMSSTTASNDTTSGALVVSGGVGISNNLNVAGTSNLEGLLTLGVGGTSYALPTAVGGEGEILTVSGGDLIFSAGGADTVTGPSDFGTDNRMVRTVGVNKEVEATGVTVTDGDGMTVPGASTFSSTLKVAGALTLGTGGTAYDFPTVVGTEGDILAVSAGGDLEFVAGISSNTSTTTITSDTVITSTTASNSATEGALVVSGGVGITGDVNIDGDLAVSGASNLTTLAVSGASTMADTTQSTDCSTGALIVSGGVGIAKNLNVCGNFDTDGSADVGTTLLVSGATTLSSTVDVTGVMTINDTTQATNDSVGALVVLGGIGVAKDVVIGGDLTVNGQMFTINSTTTAIFDPIFKLADGNPADTVDFGFYGEYDTSSTAKYAGLFRDSADGKFKLFVDTQTEPTDPGQINTSATGYTPATLVLGPVESTSIDASGVVHITDVTESTEATSGALVVDGGVGVAKNLNVAGATALSTTLSVGGLMTVDDVTQSLDTTSGALVVDGGVGIVKNLNVGGDFDVVGASTMTSLTVSGTMSLDATTESDDSTTGALVVAGGVGVAKNLNVGGATGLESTLAVTGATTLSSTLSVSGLMTVDDVTDSADSTSGALVVDGGIGVAKNLNVGGATGLESTLVVTGATTMSSTLDVTGDTSLSTLSVSGLMTVDDVTDSADSTSGALVVDGGVGVAKNLNVGGATGLESTLVVTGATTMSSTLDVTGDTSLSTLSVSGLMTVDDVTDSADSTSGALVVDGGVGVAKNLNVGGATGLESTLVVTGATTMSSTLDVVGDSSLSTLSVSGLMTVDDVTDSSDSTSGALVVGGGVGVAKNLNVGVDLDVAGASTLASLTVSGAMALDATTQSDDTTSGALVVSGGVGIAKNLNVGGAVDMDTTLNVDGDSTFVSSVDVGGRLTVRVRDVAGSTSLDDDYILNVSATGTVTLPDITDATYDGVTYIVVKQTATDVTVTTQAADKILSGGSELDSITLSGAVGERVQLISNGDKWLPI